eukprot:6736858-Pyramimonas_sp.AAC.1
MFRLGEKELTAAGTRSRSKPGSQRGRPGSVASSRPRGGARAQRSRQPLPARRSEAGGARAARPAPGGEDDLKMDLGKNYGIPMDTLDKLPPMNNQLMAKIVPILMKAVLGNSFTI